MLAVYDTHWLEYYLTHTMPAAAAAAAAKSRL